MLFSGDAVFFATYDSEKADLIQMYGLSGGLVRSFLKKTSLYPIRRDIFRGLSPNDVESIVFEGVLRLEGGNLFYLNKRFGDVLRFDRGGTQIASLNVVPLLSKVEKAKADLNRKMFLDEGFDIVKNERKIPHNYVFEDAQIRDGRLFLLMENFDIIKKKPRSYTEIIEIDLVSWKVVNSYVAEAAAKWESAYTFLITGDGRKSVFLAPMRVPGEDEKLWLFTPVGR